MRIIVCVKQVPSTNEVNMDPVTNTIIREGIESVLNPFDTYAVEEAIRIKSALGGSIATISMGIPTVEEILRDTLALGADEGLLLTDRAFAGADTLATAYTLANGVKKLAPFDLIICGKQATDGDTAQVGPSLAVQLDIPHATDISHIESIDEKKIVCRRLTDDGYELLEMDLPALITVVKEINIPRLPSIAGIRASKKASIKKVGVNDLTVDESRLGLKGSPTQVVKTFIPSHDVDCEIITGKPEQQAATLVQRLTEKNLLDF